MLRSLCGSGLADPRGVARVGRSHHESEDAPTHPAVSTAPSAGRGAAGGDRDRQRGRVLADASPELVGTAQAVAAGAVLAVVTIAVIPHAFEEVSRRVATASVAGFVLGYLLS